MKDRNDYRKWTPVEIEADSAGYLEAQRVTREREKREQAKQTEDADLREYVKAFIANGGPESQARAEWEAARAEDAATAASTADEQARRIHQHETFRRV